MTYNYKIKYKKEGNPVKMIDYSPLWETMKRKNVSQYQMLKRGLDNRVLNSLKKNKNITMFTLEKICKILECEASDVVKFTEE